MQCDRIFSSGPDVVAGLNGELGAMEAPQQTAPAQRGGPKAGAAKKKGGAVDRRPLRFWQPFNDWWRAEFEKSGKRPAADDIMRWYNEEADSAWGADRPTLQETRVHAKCLRSVTSVRDYFREYRAKKKTEGCEEEEDLGSDDIRSTKRFSQDIATSGSGHYASSADTSSGLGLLAAPLMFGAGPTGGSGSGAGRAYGSVLEGSLGSFLQPRADSQKGGKPGRRGRHVSLNKAVKGSGSGAESSNSLYQQLGIGPQGLRLGPVDHGDMGLPCLSLGDFQSFGTMDSALPHVGRLPTAAAAAAAAAGSLEAGCSGGPGGKPLQMALPTITSPLGTGMGGFGALAGQMWPSMEQGDLASYMPGFCEVPLPGRLGSMGAAGQGLVVEGMAPGLPDAAAAAAGGQGAAAGAAAAAAGLAGVQGNTPGSQQVVSIKLEGGGQGGLLPLPGEMVQDMQQGLGSTASLAPGAARGPSSGPCLAGSEVPGGGAQELQLGPLDPGTFPALPALPAIKQQQQKQPRPRGRPPGSGAGKSKQKQKALASIPSEAAYNAARQQHRHHAGGGMEQWGSSAAAAAAAGLMPPPAGAPHQCQRHYQHQPHCPHHHPQQQQQQHQQQQGGLGFLSPPRLQAPQLLQASPFLAVYSNPRSAAQDPAGAAAAAAAVAAVGHNQAGILAELEAVKGPHIEGLLQAHCSSQQQRISQSALLDAPYDVGGIMRRVSQVSDVQRLSLRLMPSVDFDHLMVSDGYDVVSFIAGHEGDLLFQDAPMEPLVLEPPAAEQQRQQQQGQGQGQQQGQQQQTQAATSAAAQGAAGPSSSEVAPGATTPAAGAAATAADGEGAAERKRYRSCQRLSHSLVEGSLDFNKRMRASGGVSTLLMELDTPKVRALQQLPSGCLELIDPSTSPLPSIAAPAAPAAAAAAAAGSSCGCVGGGQQSLSLSSITAAAAAAAAARAQQQAAAQQVAVAAAAAEGGSFRAAAVAQEGQESGGKSGGGARGPAGMYLCPISGATAGPVIPTLGAASMDQQQHQQEQGLALGYKQEQLQQHGSLVAGGSGVGLHLGPPRSGVDPQASAPTSQQMQPCPHHHYHHQQQQQGGALVPHAPPTYDGSMSLSGMAADCSAGKPAGSSSSFTGTPSKAILPPMHEIERMI